MILSIVVPLNGELLIKTGDKVDFSTPLVNNHVKKEVKIPLARSIHINPKKIFTVLHKFVGEKIKKGDMIASHKGFLSKNRYLSEHDGTLKEINHNDGTITLEIDSDETTMLKAYFKGEVVEIDQKTDQEKTTIQLKVKDGKQFDMKDAKDFFGGPMYYNKSKNLQVITEEDVNGYIICTQTLLPYEQTKLETLGATGFVVLHSPAGNGSIPHAKVREIPDWEELHTLQLPYCTIDREQSRMYVYSI